MLGGPPCSACPRLLSEVIDARSSITLQSLVDRWHRQHSADQVHTFASADGPPQLLVLQVARFSDVGRKLKGRISPPYTIEFPYYPDSTQRVATAPYDTCSIVFHIGSTVTCSHYRTSS